MKTALGLVAIVAGLAIWTPAARAAPEPQPIPRIDSCPSGYWSSGEYCMPGSSARFAIVRQGSCPSGYWSSGNYCMASTDSTPLAIPRLGSCPSGYYSSGNYCVSTRTGR